MMPLQRGATCGAGKRINRRHYLGNEVLREVGRCSPKEPICVQLSRSYYRPSILTCPIFRPTLRPYRYASQFMKDQVLNFHLVIIVIVVAVSKLVSLF